MTEYKEINYRGAKIGVTTNGRVFVNGKERNIFYNKDGYACCSIKTEDGWRQGRVARLVALAFIPNPDNLPEVNHKDYDRTNSNVENLEWSSRIDNVNYSKCNMPDYHGKNNPNYRNKKLSQKYAEDKKLAKEKQGRPGLKNGRCRKIKVYFNGEFVKAFDYIVDCCKYIVDRYSPNSKLESIRSQIDKSIRNNKPYKGLMFVKE